MSYRWDRCEGYCVFIIHNFCTVIFHTRNSELERPGKACGKRMWLTEVTGKNILESRAQTFAHEKVGEGAEEGGNKQSYPYDIGGVLC